MVPTIIVLETGAGGYLVLQGAGFYHVLSKLRSQMAATII